MQAAEPAALGFEHIRSVLVAFECRRHAVQLRLKGSQVVPGRGKLGMMAAKTFCKNTQRFSEALLGFGQVVKRAVARSAAVERHAQANLRHFEINGRSRKLHLFGRRR